MCLEDLSPHLIFPKFGVTIVGFKSQTGSLMVEEMYQQETKEEEAEEREENSSSGLHKYQCVRVYLYYHRYYTNSTNNNTF